MTRILITGGAGFIGSHFAELCVQKGHEVIIIDNLSRGNRQNISKIMQKIEFYSDDLLKMHNIDSIIKKSDIIFHLAALSGVIPSIENPELCFINNIQTTEFFIRKCSKYHKKVIFSSSREVYGKGIYYPVNEKHPLIPENPYGASKITGEAIINAYAQCYKFNFGIFRLANVYGPRDFDRVIPIFINNCMKDENISLYGGTQIIDFIYIDDVVNAFYKSIFEKRNFTLNLGSGNGTNILDLANLIKDIFDSKNNILIEEFRNGEVNKFISDCSEAKKFLKWIPLIQFQDGIKKTIDAYINKSS